MYDVPSLAINNWQVQINSHNVNRTINQVGNDQIKLRLNDNARPVSVPEDRLSLSEVPFSKRNFETFPNPKKKIRQFF